MTTSRDNDRLIRAFLAEGDETLEDQVYDAVRAAIERTPQRAAFGPWRMPIMNKIVGLGLAAAAVVAVVFIGSQLLPTQDGGFGAEPTTTATPEPTTTATPEPTPEPSPVRELPSWYPDSGADGAGILAAGSHSSRTFNTAFTYSVPDGWVNPNDDHNFFNLFPDTPANQSEFERSEALAHVIIMGAHPSPFFTCKTLEDNRGSTAADMVAAASANEALIVSDPVDVAIGGLTGMQIDVQRNPDWTDTCPDDSELPSGVDPEDERTRGILLDIPGQGVLVMILYSASSAEHDAFLTEAMPIVESFQFDR